MSNIVIYEENDLMRALLEEWLSEAGYRVHAAASHDRQSSRLADGRPDGRPADGCPADGRPADLAIVSVSMPKLAGAQLVREIQTMHPGTPLIAISGQFLPGLSANGAIAQALGVRQVIAKPLTRIDLLGAVRAIIGAPS